MDEGTETEVAFHELLKRMNRYNFERLGLEAKPGETEEDEKVRQLMIAKYDQGQMMKLHKHKRALSLKRTQLI